MSSPPKVLIPLAPEGSEELEFVSISNPLRRAGADVTVVSIHPSDLQVKCARGVKIVCDALLVDVKDATFDAIVLPGGMPGAKLFHECEDLINMLQRHKKEEKHLAAVCASPAVVFAQNGILEDVGKAICYPAGPFDEMMGSRLRLKVLSTKRYEPIQ
jgi:protein deglycase